MDWIHVFGRARLVSCNCFSLCAGMCACLPPRPLITSGMISCDIDCVRLVKQVLWLFPAFNYFIRHLPSIKWMGVAILTQHVVNACQRKLRWHGTHYKGTTQKMERFIYKSEWANASLGQMRNNAFKRRPVFSFTVTISA